MKTWHEHRQYELKFKRASQNSTHVFEAHAPDRFWALFCSRKCHTPLISIPIPWFAQHAGFGLLCVDVEAYLPVIWIHYILLHIILIQILHYDEKLWIYLDLFPFIIDFLKPRVNLSAVAAGALRVALLFLLWSQYIVYFFVSEYCAYRERKRL